MNLAKQCPGTAVPGSNAARVLSKVLEGRHPLQGIGDAKTGVPRQPPSAAAHCLAADAEHRARSEAAHKRARSAPADARHPAPERGPSSAQQRIAAVRARVLARASRATDTSEGLCA